MFLLLLKTEKPGGCTSLNFVGMYASQEEAQKYTDRENGPFKPSGFGNYRMLTARGQGPALKEVQETGLFNGSSYLIAEY